MAQGEARDVLGKPGAEFDSQLKWYYGCMFPIDDYYRWLSYGDKSYFSRREVSFTLQGDIYLRYRSFSTAAELLDMLKGRVPIKMDVGAVYNVPPKDRGSFGAALAPLEKEFVIDIDMSDYEDVMGDLKKGSEMEMCDNNWVYMSAAAKIVDAALRQDFGFKHIMWVYSGRRGIHCWVADKRARKLSNEVRTSIVNYLSIRTISIENAGRKFDDLTNPLHPSLARAKREVCEPLFKEFVLNDQGMLATGERVEHMLAYVHDKNVREKLVNRLTSSTNSRLSGPEKWERIKQELIRHSELENRCVLDYIIFHYTYPRLDVNVSKDVGHLLKGPFCVHPGTGRVCVPFRVEDLSSFHPREGAPHIQSLIDDVNNQGQGLPVGDAVRQFEAAAAIFKDFVDSIHKEIGDENRKSRLENLDMRSAAEFVSV
eukprot:CAMPEP_0198731288 /NCGR_PEP_ID=MMETSP1475-20131203/29192_1 /TAXON_ID= ORGANISM="Unidentified sp., Strain CCMP1999" /NCGR_SAMPLE_ID=MMETSP1475 /ASSEMBLY_ACC=CAM_ASM_001111 /LENGTH=426 /DNA_ID=CAMNT_0044494241 /DNA_START=33 /DNA_END=1313 /DNA_ORIENTATION=-